MRAQASPREPIKNATKGDGGVCYSRMSQSPLERMKTDETPLKDVTKEGWMDVYVCVCISFTDIATHLASAFSRECVVPMYSCAWAKTINSSALRAGASSWLLMAPMVL